MRYTVFFSMKKSEGLTDGFMLMNPKNNRLSLGKIDNNAVSYSGVPVFDNYIVAEMFARIIYNSIKKKERKEKQLRFFVKKIDTPDFQFKVRKTEPTGIQNDYKTLCDKYGIDVLLYEVVRKH